MLFSITSIFISTYGSEQQITDLTVPAVTAAGKKRATIENLMYYLRSNDFVEIFENAVVISGCFSRLEPHFLEDAFYRRAYAEDLHQRIAAACIDNFNTIQIKGLHDLFIAYEVPKLLKINKVQAFSLIIDCFSLIIDCFSFIQDKNNQTILDGLVKVDSLKMNQSLKEAFERTRLATSIKISAGDASCLIPQAVAAVFPFLQVIGGGGFRESGSRTLVLDRDYHQATLDLFKHLLFYIYRYSQLYPQLYNSQVVDEKLTDFLYYRVVVDMMKTYFSFHELLELAHGYDIKNLTHVMVRYLWHQENMLGTDFQKS